MVIMVTRFHVTLAFTRENVNMGEESAAQRRGVWSLWSNCHAEKIAPRMVAHYLYLYTYIIFLRIIQ